MNHNRNHYRLFKKTFRHRPNQRLQYLKKRNKTRAKNIRRALRRGELVG